MTTKNTDTPKIKVLQQLYDVIELDIKRDFAEPIVHKGRPTWMGGDGVIKLDKEREEKRQIQLHRKYDERVRAAISIWETYPDCLSEPPMSNPSPKIGLHELKVWVRKELKNAGTNAQTQPSNKAGKTGENATLGSKIKDFFWTLYEKTLKVIVDAAFERWWPK
jgi:hypothetical protein